MIYIVCVCVCAVSYTHLDVYKRQALGGPDDAFGVVNSYIPGQIWKPLGGGASNLSLIHI